MNVNTINPQSTLAMLKMSTLAAVALALAGLGGGCTESTFAEGGDPAAPAWRMALTPGQTYRQRLEMTSDMRLPMGIPDADHKKSDLEVVCRVVEARPAGGATVEVTLDRLNVSMVSLGVRAAYNSEEEIDPAALESRARRFYDVFDGLVGLRYTAEVDERGAVVALREVPERLDRARRRTIEGSLGEDQIVMLFAEENLRDLVSPPFLAALATTAVEPNDVWRGEQMLAVPRAAPLPGTRTFELAAVETAEDGALVAVISTRTVLTEEEADRARTGQRGGGLEIVQGAVRGQIEFSLSAGMPRSLNESTRTEIRTTQAPARSPGRDGRQNRIFYDVKRQISLIE